MQGEEDRKRKRRWYNQFYQLQLKQPIISVRFYEDNHLEQKPDLVSFSSQTYLIDVM